MKSKSKSNSSPIIFEELVANKINFDYGAGLIRDRATLIKKILEYDLHICMEKDIKKQYEKETLAKSTLSKFMKKYKIQTVTSFLNNLGKDLQSSKIAEGKLIKQMSSNLHDDDDYNNNNNFDSTTIAPEDYDHKNNEACIMVNKGTISDSLATRLLSFENILEENEGEIEMKYNAIIHYQGEKITELTKICSGLSNKIPPSSMVSSKLSSSAAVGMMDHVGENIIELEQSRSLHLCIRSFIQVLSPIKKLTEWIIQNDFLIISSSPKKIQQGVVQKEEDKKFRQLANTWFWDGILKYESLEENAEKVKILQRFGYKIKDLCKNHDQVFGTSFTSEANHASTRNKLGFIPPPPQKIIDMIIQQHYNHFLDLDLGPDGQMYDLPNLPLKKIQLVPPANTKPFEKVSFCNWRSKVDNMDFGSGEDDKKREGDSASKSPPEILFAELSFDQEKLTYIHFEWPDFEEEVILEGEKFYSYHLKKRVSQQITHKKCHSADFDYQMIGVIWGRQYAGDWEGFRQDGLLPHLGLHKNPVTYIYATKRNTSSKNPKQGRWYLCLDDNYVSFFKPKELTNNFQDVLLHMNNNHHRTYRPQLLVFQKMYRPQPAFQFQQQDEIASPVSIHQYEPSLHKNIISSVMAVPYECQEGSSLLVSSRSRTTLTTAVEKKKLKRKEKSSLIALRPDLQLTSKKKLVETIDTICNAIPISITKDDDGAADLDRFFSYDKASDYPKGPSGLQITQTHDQKRYYATLTPRRGGTKSGY